MGGTGWGSYQTASTPFIDKYSEFRDCLVEGLVGTKRRNSSFDFNQVAECH